MQRKLVSLADAKKCETTNGKPTRNGKELPKPKRNFAHPQGKVVTTNKTQALPQFIDRLRRKHLSGERLTKEQHRLLLEAGSTTRRNTLNKRQSGRKTSSPKRPRPYRIITPPPPKPKSTSTSSASNVNSSKRKRKRKLQITLPQRSAKTVEKPDVDVVDKLSSGLSTTR